MNAGVPIGTPVPVASALAARDVEHARDAEVEHLDRPVARDEEVRRLDVAVDDARLACAAASTSSSWCDDRDARRAGEAPPGRRARAPRRVAVEQLHHEERRAVLGHVVVDHEHRARVLHRVGGVALAQEARADVRARDELRVEHLDGELRAVAVGRA